MSIKEFIVVVLLVYIGVKIYDRISVRKVKYKYVTYKKFKRLNGIKARRGSNKIGSIIISEPTRTRDGYPRVAGAILYINAKLADRRFELVNSGKVQRSNKDRYKAIVPGYKQVANKIIKFKGKDYALWHRTHLIPFRYSFTEGLDTKYFLFTGTGHLNSGSRPQEGYIVTNATWRRDYLVDNYYIKNNPKISYFNVRFGSKGEKVARLSLDDCERYADWIIRNKPNADFKYSVECLYDNDFTEIPSSVRVLLVNLVDRSLVFEAEISNIL